MNKSARIAASFFVLFLILSPIQDARAVYSGPLNFGFRDVLFYQPSNLQIKIEDPNKMNLPAYQRYSYYNCPEWKQSDCSKVADLNATYRATIVLPPCAEPTATYCIENLSFRKAEDEWSNASLIRSINAPRHAPVEEINLPYSGSMSLWSISTKNPKLNSKFAVFASFEIPESTLKSKTNKFTNLQIRILPYQDAVFDSKNPPKIYAFDTGIDINGNARFGVEQFPEKTVWEDDLGRGIITDWDPDLQAQVSLRIPNSISGWMGGRLNQAQVDIEPYSPTMNRLTVSAGPVDVPRISIDIPQDQLTSTVKNLFPGWDWTNPPGGVIQNTDVAGDYSLKLLDAIRSFAKDKSTDSEKVWILKSFVPSSQRCLNDSSRLLGFVTTNAAVYSTDPPQYAGGSLNYSVGSMHFDSHGSVFEGNYQLILRSDIARCLYGFTNAPIEASVSISGEGFNTQIPTSSSMERNGWISLSAYKFHFSNPVLSVVFSQKIVAESSQSTSITNSQKTPAGVNLLKSVKCSKGKIVKVFKNTGGICPSGYKKTV